jgi:hypothetical protein
MVPPVALAVESPIAKATAFMSYRSWSELGGRVLATHSRRVHLRPSPGRRPARPLRDLASIIQPRLANPPVKTRRRRVVAGVNHCSGACAPARAALLTSLLGRGEPAVVRASAYIKSAASRVVGVGTPYAGCLLNVRQPVYSPREAAVGPFGFAADGRGLDHGRGERCAPLCSARPVDVGSVFDPHQMYDSCFVTDAVDDAVGTAASRELAE